MSEFVVRPVLNEIHDAKFGAVLVEETTDA